MCNLDKILMDEANNLPIEGKTKNDTFVESYFSFINCKTAKNKKKTYIVIILILISIFLTASILIAFSVLCNFI